MTPSPVVVRSTFPEDIMWALLAGSITTLAGGYIFGQGNQWVAFVQLYRLLDPDYLRADWFVNAVEGTSSRIYYLIAIGALLRVLPLESLMLVLTMLGNAGIALVTCRAVRHAVPEGTVEPRVATVLALGVLGFGAGGAGQLARNFVEPSLLARTPALAGLLCLMQGRTASSALLFVASTALHPLVGTETFAIGALAGLSAWYVADGRVKTFPWRYVGSGTVLCGSAWLLWGGKVSGALDSEQFHFVVTEVRSPHHYLPSTFGAGALLACAAFMVAATVAWSSLRRRSPRLDPVLGWLLVWAAAALLAGWVFVEIWPARLVVQAQTFRMTYLIKWVGFILIASNAVRWWSQAASGSTTNAAALRVAACVSLLMFGRLYALGALGGQILGYVAERRSSYRLSLLVPFLLGIALAGAALLPINQRVGEPLVGWLLLGLVVLPFVGVVGLTLRRASIAAVLLGLTAGWVLRSSPITQEVARMMGTRAPIVRWADFVGNSVGIEQ